jgi:hypothetical protein
MALMRGDFPPHLMSRPRIHLTRSWWRGNPVSAAMLPGSVNRANDAQHGELASDFHFAQLIQSEPVRYPSTELPLLAWVHPVDPTSHQPEHLHQSRPRRIIKSFIIRAEQFDKLLAEIDHLDFLVRCCHDGARLCWPVSSLICSP